MDFMLLWRFLNQAACVVGGVDIGLHTDRDEKPSTETNQ